MRHCPIRGFLCQWKLRLEATLDRRLRPLSNNLQSRDIEIEIYKKKGKERKRKKEEKRREGRVAYTRGISEFERWPVYGSGSRFYSRVDRKTRAIRARQRLKVSCRCERAGDRVSGDKRLKLMAG
mgnify:CR=1 FL=1